MRKSRPSSEGNQGAVRGQVNFVLPLNLRLLVDESDGCAHDDPLNEVGDRLVDCQREADVQVDVVVDREGADREKTDECAEVYA